MLAVLPWNLDPIAIAIGPVRVRWYGILFTAGIALAARLARPLVRQIGISQRDDDRLLASVVAGVLIGARLGHVLFYEPARYLAHPLDILAVWHGGLASHGGVIGLVLALAWFARHRGIPVLSLLDVAATVAPFTGTAIRLGNFCNSEIIGRPTTVPWAVQFLRVDLVPRHPTQLYEAAGYLLIGLFLWRSARQAHVRPSGWLLGWALVLVFSARFGLEFLKEPQVAVEAGWPLDLGQLLSLPAIALGLVLLIRSWRTSPRFPSPPSDFLCDQG